MNNPTYVFGTSMIPIELGPDAIMPVRADPQAAGYDVFASKLVGIPKGQIKKIPLGFCLSLPNGFMATIRDRSSKALQGLHVVGGLIDSNYTGEWNVVMSNHGNDRIIQKGEKIAQFTIHRYETFNLQPGKIPKEEIISRGSGGFGSTD